MLQKYDKYNTFLHKSTKYKILWYNSKYKIKLRGDNHGRRKSRSK